MRSKAEPAPAPGFAYRRHADQDRATPARRPVVVVGAGPVGLALAIDLAQRAVPVVLLDDDASVATGSRAICFAKRSLEIFDRLGCGQSMVEQGVSWNVGKVFFGSAEVYRFDLLAEPGHARPAFINLPQDRVERLLVERARALPALDLRWRSEVVGLEQHADHARLTIATPDGPYTLHADHVVACDGSRSALRRLAGLESRGRSFRDRFLIADVRMRADFPAERWFWFDPPFHPGQSVLLHRQPDDVWRIDFQLGWDADPEVERRPENILPRVRALLAGSALEGVPFELEWASVYTFACTRIARFRVGRVLYAGDAAHGVSPFGARGANSGIQDADNLGWKLAAVLGGRAGEALLDSYASEREAAADENIRQSSRSTDFITPKSEASRLFRDAVLELARAHRFARALVNSGRLSVPATLDGSPLNTPDTEPFAGGMRPGAAALDAPVTRPDGSHGWLLEALGAGFTVLVAVGGEVDGEKVAQFGADPSTGRDAITVLRVASGRTALSGELGDPTGRIAERYDLRPGTTYLFRPDQHVCARWRVPSTDAVRAAMRRALPPPSSADPPIDVPAGLPVADASGPSALLAPFDRLGTNGSGAEALEAGQAEQSGRTDPAGPTRHATVLPARDEPVDARAAADALLAPSATSGTLLTTEPNFASPDDVYEALIAAHRDLSSAASHALNARLVLLLANHVGRTDVIEAALAAARAGSFQPPPGTPTP